jgi:HlyD family secretion protein
VTLVRAQATTNDCIFKEDSDMSTEETYRPRRGGFLVKTFFLLVAVGVGAFGAIAISRSDLLSAKSGNDDVIKTEDVAPPIDWAAAAPGRIEPKTGFVRVGAQLLGRIAEVTVKLNDKVEQGELLIRLDDD